MKTLLKFKNSYIYHYWYVQVLGEKWNQNKFSNLNLLKKIKFNNFCPKFYILRYKASILKAKSSFK